jgi:hypothetical protein
LSGPRRRTDWRPAGKVLKDMGVTLNAQTRKHVSDLLIGSLRGYPGIFSRDFRYLKASDSLAGFGFKSLSIR